MGCLPLFVFLFAHWAGGGFANLIYLSAENTRHRILSPTPQLNHPILSPQPPPLRILPSLPSLAPLILLFQKPKRIYDHTPHHPPHTHLPIDTPYPTCTSPGWATCCFVCGLFGRDCLFICGVGGLGCAFVGRL